MYTTYWYFYIVGKIIQLTVDIIGEIFVLNV